MFKKALLVLLLPILALSQAFADGHKKQIPVAIVGGGLSGLSVAYKLKQKNVSYELFEVSERLGGRVNTLTPQDIENLGVKGVDSYINIGGTFIDSTQLEIQEMAKNFGLELFEWDESGKDNFSWKSYLTMVNGKYILLEQWEEVFPKLFSDYLSVMQTLEGSVKLAWGKGNKAQKIKLDNMTFEKYLESISVNKECEYLLKLFFRGNVSGYWAESFTDVSALSVLQYIGINMNDEEIVMSPRHDEKFRVRGGSEEIVKGLERAIGDKHVHFAHQLVAVQAKTTSGPFTLTLYNWKDKKNINVEAKRLVLSIPLSKLKKVKLEIGGFDPKFMETINNANYGKIVNAYLFFKQPLWIDNEHDGSICFEADYCTWDAFNGHKTNQGALRLFIGGKTAQSVAENPDTVGKAIIESVREKLDQFWPGFNNDNLFLGYLLIPHIPAYAGASLVGNELKYGEHDQYKYQNLYFSGDFFGGKDQGFMNGAIRSGLRVGDLITRGLGK